MLEAAEKQTYYIILETGLGGRYDATNTAYIQHKTTVITTMGQDHAHLLGKNIYSILAEKTAIARGGAVFVGYNKDFIIEAIRANLPGMDIRLPDFSRLPEAEKLFTKPYSYNYLNALNVAEYLLGKEQPILPAPLPPCRLERFGRVILDGAHNPSGLISLMKSFGENIPSAVVVGITNDRDITKHLHIIKSYIKNIYLTLIPDNERSASVDELKKTDQTVFNDPKDALEAAQASYSGDILVTGSLYLCAHVREMLI
jgi:dihydrofolate synthase/folylpolyglutamate synthase